MSIVIVHVHVRTSAWVNNGRGSSSTSIIAGLDMPEYTHDNMSE
jgi:homoserine kinase